MAKENREVKSSVIVEIEKFRVDNVFYMNFKNDFSFGTGGKVIVMGEHQ